jgi:ribosomal protein S18 acetylase RimI-like enzyme
MPSELLRRVKSERMHRISLEVVADNECAVHLYKKLGFKVEGVLKDAYYGEDGNYQDELAMALILEWCA